VTLSHHDLTEAICDLLPDWLPHQRWYGAKQQAILAVRPVREAVLHDGGHDGPTLVHLVVSVETEGQLADRHDDDGEASEQQLYQLLVGLRRHIPERLDHAVIGAAGEGLVAYDAAHDTELTAVLLWLIAHDTERAGLRFSREPGIEIDTGLTSRPILGEQSNTSVIYGDQYILKLFRKLQLGVSADLELHRALRRVGSQHIAEPFGAIEGELDGQPVSFGILQRFFANCADGWRMAVTSVRDLIAEPDLRPDEAGADFAGESERLGRAVAAIHGDLAEALGTGLVPTEQVHTVAARMTERLEAMVRRVPSLGAYADAIRDVFDEVGKLAEPVPTQRIHGDLHLGQCLRTVYDWVVIDFEGEPSRPLADRIAMMSPLRDVAGMLRSFDYAAYHLLADQGPPESEAAAAQLEYRALEWADRNREAFCAGYAEVGPDPRAFPVLLRALELEKAVYEVGYEYDNRPSWIDVPLRSIARLAQPAS
jgi:maltokinase